MANHSFSHYLNQSQDSIQGFEDSFVAKNLVFYQAVANYIVDNNLPDHQVKLLSSNLSYSLQESTDAMDAFSSVVTTLSENQVELTFTVSKLMANNWKKYDKSDAIVKAMTEIQKHEISDEMLQKITDSSHILKSAIKDDGLDNALSNMEKYDSFYKPMSESIKDLFAWFKSSVPASQTPDKSEELVQSLPDDAFSVQDTE